MAEPLPAEGDVPDTYLDSVLADAADRTGVGSDDLLVIRSDAVTWRDGSMGCPEPGMSYTQALVPGYWIEIQAGETVLDYRLNSEGSFRLCESAGFVVPEPFHKGDPIDPGS